MAAMFFCLGLYSYKMKTPMHFWDGTIGNSHAVTDIKAYNREQAIMWFGFSPFILLVGIVGFFLRLQVFRNADDKDMK